MCDSLLATTSGARGVVVVQSLLFALGQIMRISLRCSSGPVLGKGEGGYGGQFIDGHAPPMIGS